MVKVSREVSIGALVSIVGYIIMVIWFAAYMKFQVTALDTRVSRIESEIDNWIVKTQEEKNGKTPENNKNNNR